jgi:exonuclease VII large subunit
MHALRAIALILVCATAQPGAAQQKKTSAAPQNHAQERQQEIDALRQENSELQRQLEEAQIQSDQARQELEQARATLMENRSGGDSLLKELQQTKMALARSESRAKSLEAEAATLRGRVEDTTAAKEGAFVQLGPDIVPAECINLRRMAPNTKKVSGVVVVNVLISEQGEPLDVRLIQGLPGKETVWTAKAHEACLEAARRLAFHPATTKDGSVRLKVWQGVGFYLN